MVFIALQVSKKNNREQARTSQYERGFDNEQLKEASQRAKQEELEKNKDNAEYQIKRLRNDRNRLLNELGNNGWKMSTSQKNQIEKEADEIGEELICWIEKRLEELRDEKNSALEEEDDERAGNCQREIDILEHELHKLQN